MSTRGAVHCLRYGDGAEPRERCTTCARLRRRRAAPAGVTQPASASSSASRRAALRRHRAHRRPPVHECRGARAGCSTSARSRSRSRRASTTGSASASPGEGHAGLLGSARRRCLRRLSASDPDARFVREGDDVFSTVDLTIMQAALGATVRCQRSQGPVELEFEPGTQPGEVVGLCGGRACRCSRASGAATTACS